MPTATYTFKCILCSKRFILLDPVPEDWISCEACCPSCAIVVGPICRILKTRNTSGLSRAYKETYNTIKDQYEEAINKICYDGLEELYETLLKFTLEGISLLLVPDGQCLLEGTTKDIDIWEWSIKQVLNN